jgi:hypothetical protein
MDPKEEKEMAYGVNNNTCPQYSNDWNPQDYKDLNPNQDPYSGRDPNISSGYSDRTVPPSNFPFPSDMSKDLDDLYQQVLKDSILPYDQKNDLLVQIKNLKIKLAGLSDGTPPSKDVLDQFNLLPTQIADAEAEAKSEAQQAKKEKDQTNKLVSQIDDLNKQIETNLSDPDVSTEMKDKLNELKTKLGTAKSSLDLTPNQDTLEKAQKTFSEVKKEFGAMGKDLKKDAQYPNWVDELASYTGASADSIISAIKSNFLMAPSDPKEFENWLKDNFPPMKDGNPSLDKNFSQFLRAVDPRLASAMDGLKGKDISDCQQEVSEIQDRMVQDLSKIFADKGVSISKGDLNFNEASYSTNEDWRTVGYDIKSMMPTVVVNGKTYSFFATIGAAVGSHTGEFGKDFGSNCLEFSEISSGDDAEKIVKNLESAFSE